MSCAVAPGAVSSVVKPGRRRPSRGAVDRGRLGGPVPPTPPQARAQACTPAPVSFANLSSQRLAKELDFPKGRMQIIRMPSQLGGAGGLLTAHHLVRLDLARQSQEVEDEDATPNGAGH